MCGQVILYSDRKQVFVGKTEISLTLKEYQLLEYFIMNQNQVLTKEMIMENIWGIDSEFIDPNTISVMISRLKKKLNESSKLSVMYLEWDIEWESSMAVAIFYSTF